jgi:uncharacterized protein YbcI
MVDSHTRIDIGRMERPRGPLLLRRRHASPYGANRLQVRIHRDSYGTGAGAIRAYLNDDCVLVILDDLELQRSGTFLHESGEGQAVIDVRNHYQQAIEATFRAAVERATGRRVVSFVSATKLDPHYAVEVFRLGPALGDASGDPRD